MTCLVVLKPMVRNMRRFCIAILASLIATPGIAKAATDGGIDTTSTGTSSVFLTKQDIVQITGVEDIVFENVSRIKSNVEISMNMCVHNSAAKYSVTVTSRNRAFNLANGSNNIPYTITWDGADVNYSSAVTGLTGTSDINCSDEQNATMEVNLVPEYFNDAPAGMYFDVLTIEVAPE